MSRVADFGILCFQENTTTRGAILIPKLTIESFTLATLRERIGWTQARLAKAADLSRVCIAYYETGYRRLERYQLFHLAALMGHSAMAVECVLFAMVAVLPPSAEQRLAAGLTEKEAIGLRAAASRLGLSSAQSFEREMVAAGRAQRLQEARDGAGEVLRQLQQRAASKRGQFLETLALPTLYALVERLCDSSHALAASDPFGAIRPAELAVLVAGSAPKGRERSFLQGWSTAFVGNALRAASDLPASDQAFGRSDRFLRDATPFRDLPLPAWRPLDMKASLRCDQRRWTEAVDLHGEALEAVPASDRGIALLNLASTLEQMGDHENSVEALREAGPPVDAMQRPRLRFAHRFNLAVNLVHAGQALEAEAMLPEVRSLAVGMGNELDLMRVLWLSGRIDAALGRWSEALASFVQARVYFTERRLACDAADLALEEAVLRLEAGDTRAAKTIAEQIAWVFEAQGMHQDALAAVRLFVNAAELEEATADYTRKLLLRFREAPRPVAPPNRAP